MERYIEKVTDVAGEMKIRDYLKGRLGLSTSLIGKVKYGGVILNATPVTMRAMIKNGEAFLCGVHISPYEQGNRFNHDAMRDRKLLLHKREIMRLLGYIQQKGLTLVPTELYFSNGRVKVELGVARGKKLYDKRDAMAEKETKREIDRRLKEAFHE